MASSVFSASPSFLAILCPAAHRSCAGRHTVCLGGPTFDVRTLEARSLAARLFARAQGMLFYCTHRRYALFHSDLRLIQKYYSVLWQFIQQIWY